MHDINQLKQLTAFTGSYLKIGIFVRNQSAAKKQFSDLPKHVGNLSRGHNAVSGRKDFFEMASKLIPAAFCFSSGNGTIYRISQIADPAPLESSGGGGGGGCFIAAALNFTPAQE